MENDEDKSLDLTDSDLLLPWEVPYQQYSGASFIDIL